MSICLIGLLVSIGALAIAIFSLLYAVSKFLENRTIDEELLGQ